VVEVLASFEGDDLSFGSKKRSILIELKKGFGTKIGTNTTKNIYFMVPFENPWFQTLILWFQTCKCSKVLIIQ